MLIEPIPEKRFAFSGKEGQRPVSDRPVSTDRLSGRPEPQSFETLLYEKPWHSNVAMLFASGKFTAKTIAAQCDCTPAHIGTLLKQPWFQQKISQFQQENGGGDIMELFKAEAYSSLATLIEIRDNEKAPPSVRSANALAILHQVMGKPTQRVEQTVATVSEDPVAEVARLEAENLRLSTREACASEACVGGDSLSFEPTRGLDQT